MHRQLPFLRMFPFRGSRSKLCRGVLTQMCQYRCRPQVNCNDLGNRLYKIDLCHIFLLLPGCRKVAVWPKKWGASRIGQSDSKEVAGTSGLRLRVGCAVPSSAQQRRSVFVNERNAPSADQCRVLIEGQRWWIESLIVRHAFLLLGKNLSKGSC